MRLLPNPGWGLQTWLLGSQASLLSTCRLGFQRPGGVLGLAVTASEVGSGLLQPAPAGHPPSAMPHCAWRENRPLH